MSPKHSKPILYGVMNVLIYNDGIASRNNASISNFGGGFGCKSEYPWCIIEFSKKSKKQKKSDGKTGIFTHNQFSTKSIFLYDCNSKIIHCKYLKISQNTFIDVDKKILDDQKHSKIQHMVPYDCNFFISVYTSNFYEICRKRENLQVMPNISRSI
ncbi:Uncharacterized protein FWK35_00028524 [Aphis craccivora]|uniref:Uncharacterized protein n=1 Tax=Aphis craccivora TaxID=307492 RepID=A0A6G0ZCN6_APHCR|nr:Uncharacterized protein FWK35_00028524 [Aphis craccivora]